MANIGSPSPGVQSVSKWLIMSQKTKNPDDGTPGVASGPLMFPTPASPRMVRHSRHIASQSPNMVSQPRHMVRQSPNMVSQSRHMAGQSPYMVSLSNHGPIGSYASSFALASEGCRQLTFAQALHIISRVLTVPAEMAPVSGAIFSARASTPGNCPCGAMEAQSTCNRQVRGSNPLWGSIRILGAAGPDLPESEEQRTTWRGG